ncbi:MAG: CPBP family intramembrane glutamic endopeptidase, partial [Terriglobia bacterium]
IDQVFWFLLILAMLVILVQRLRDRDVPLRISLMLGLVAMGLDLLSRLNNFPLDKFYYRTTDSFPNFLTSYLLTAILGAMGIGVIIFLVVASSEPVYRESFPRLLSFRRYFSWNGLRTRSFLMANIVGITLTFFFFAYQTVFYLAANHLGAWAPSDIPFSNQLNTAIPWVAVLFTGFFPAVTEELQFRAFAIPFFKKVTKSWPLALVLAAFNWGFLHSAYPNQPFFIRGLEVGLGGILIGVIMLRFGIIATMMWHYSVDALYEAFILLRSSNHYLMLSGGLCAGVMLIPLIVALVAYWRTGDFTDESPLTNASEGIARAQHETAAEVKPRIHYQPYSRRRVLAALIVIVVFGALGFLKVYRLGRGTKIGTTRTAATETARDYLSALHVNTTTYRSVAWLRENVDQLALRYFLERLPAPKAGQIIREASEPMLWEVRLFRPLEKEEHIVFVDAASGKVYGHEHVLPEIAPGASLTPAQALALGEHELVKQGYKLSNFALQDSMALKRPAREDYTLVWQARPGDPRNVGEAHYRLEVDLAGDQLAGFHRSFKLPESWVREQETTRLADSVFSGAAILLGIGFITGGVWLFAIQVRRGAVRWMKALKIAVVFTALLALFELNSLPALARAYDTSISLANFRLQVGVSYLVVLILAGALVWLLLALATSLYPESWQLFDSGARRVWRRDATVAAAMVFAVGAGLTKLLAFLSDRFHAHAYIAYPGPHSQWGSYSPGLGCLLQGLLASVVSVVVLAAVIYGVTFGWRRKAWWLWLSAAFLLVAMGPSSAHDAGGFAMGWVMRFVPLLAAVVVIIFFFRDNPLAYVTAAFSSVIAGPVVALLSEPVTFYRLNGVFLAVAAGIILIWLLLPGSKMGMQTEPEP